MPVQLSLAHKSMINSFKLRFFFNFRSLRSCQSRFTNDQIAAMQATLRDKILRPQRLRLEKKPSIEGRNLNLNMATVVELKQLQRSPIQSPPSINLLPPVSEPVPEVNSRSIVSGIYIFDPSGGPCPGQYISANPGKRCSRGTRLRNFSQASRCSRILRGRVNHGKELESLAASTRPCTSKYLADPKSGTNLGGNAGKWKIDVVGRAGNRSVV